MIETAPSKSFSKVTRPSPLKQSSVLSIWRNRKARVGIMILLLLVLVAAFAPTVAPYDPSLQQFLPNQGITLQHLLGTTGTGQDVFSQFIYGTRASLFVAFGAGILTTLLGVVVGLISGFLMGWVDELLSLISNVFLVIPALPLMVVLAAYIKVHGLSPVILVITVTSWAWGARILRSQVVSLRNRDYIWAARFAGDSVWRIIWNEILPNMLSLVAAAFLNAAVSAVLAESSLEFLGLGDPSLVSWGTMLYWANNNNALLNGQWLWVLAPGLGIAVLGTAFVLINFGIDELTNPRLR